MTLRLDCQIEGIGVDPTDPPLVWEAWAGNEWRRCDVERDTTGGLNRGGDVVLHVPSTHEVSVIDSIRAGWIRARVLAAREGQPGYSASPRIAALSGFTSGGTAEAVNAETVTDEVIGVSEGVPGQRFQLQRAPVVPGQEVVVDVASGDGWQEWRAVTTFAESDADDRHFQLDATAGEIMFGPAVRLADGSLRSYGGGATEGRRAADPRVPHGRWPAGERRPRRDHGAALVDPDRRPGRQPVRGGRWDRR